MAEEKKEYLVLDNEFVEQLKEIPTKIDNLADEMKSMKEEMNSKIDNLADEMKSMKQEMNFMKREIDFKINFLVNQGERRETKRRKTSSPLAWVLSDSAGKPSILK